MKTPRHTLSLLAALTILTPSVAMAQGALDTLRATQSPRHVTTQRIQEQGHSMEDIEPGQTIKLASQRTSLRTINVKTSEFLRPAKGNRYIAARTTCHDYLLVVEYTHRKALNLHPHTKKLKGYVLNLKDNSRSETFLAPSEDIICQNDRMIMRRYDGAPAVFSFEDQSIHIPSVSLPNSETLSHMDDPTPIMPEDGSQATHFLVRAVSKDKKFYFSLWSPDDDHMDFTELPFDGVSAAQFNNDTIDMAGFTVHTSQVTDAFSDNPRTYSNTQIHHHAYNVGDDITRIHEGSANTEVSLIKGGYIAISEYNSQRILYPDNTELQISSEDCDPRSKLKLADVSRATTAALFTCRTSEDTTQYQLVYWTPEQTYTLNASGNSFQSPRPAQNWEFADGPVPIVVISESTWDPKRWEYNHKYFDIDRGVLWHGDARYELSISPGRSPRVFLAADKEHKREEFQKGKKIKLFKVDIDRGTETLIHTYTDCPGQLVSSHRNAGITEVHCVTNPNKGKFEYIQQWSEVIDLENYTRFRVPKNRYVSDILPDGRFVINTADKGDNLLYHNASKLWVGSMR